MANLTLRNIDSMSKLDYLFFCFAIILSACATETKPVKADLILTNGNFYTLNSSNPRAEAVAISGDTIIAVGSEKEMESLRDQKTEIHDLQGRFAMPGLIEGHGHFRMMGQLFTNLDLRNTDTWEEVVSLVSDQAAKIDSGQWIYGRGWHQEKWSAMPAHVVEGYPDHRTLSAVSPDNPVILEHASGHGLMANAEAMRIAGINRETTGPEGGRIVRDQEGEAIGVFEENAARLIEDRYDEYLNNLTSEEEKTLFFSYVDSAQRECLKYGITSFQDAGSTTDEFKKYQSYAQERGLKMRLYIMLREPYDSLRTALTGFPKIGLHNSKLTCRAIKGMIDGALGSYGAWLLEPYSDKPGFYGQNTSTVEEITQLGKLAASNDMQYCVHAIGDRANREVLNIYEEIFEGRSSDKDNRWRIEHVQNIHPTDQKRMYDLGVIASMQANHCTSDAPFVEKRLGEQRAESEAYPWRSLLDAGVVIANGTDAPVEDVNPFANLYASVTRKPLDGSPAFYPKQAMTREEALRSYTLSNAYAAFEEDIKGSLEPGKLADIIVLSKDLLHCSDDEILQTRVLMTMIGGQIVYTSMSGE